VTDCISSCHTAEIHLLSASLKLCAGRIAGAEDMTESVQAGMKSMEDQIKEVAAEIKEATQKWENCSPESKEFWRQKEARLGRMQEMLLQHQLNPTQQGASSPGNHRNVPPHHLHCLHCIPNPTCAHPSNAVPLSHSALSAVLAVTTPLP
jgi:septal ring factor EnvC (AmiA/AmiB activator)